jgi:hypothetical protein
MQKRRVVLRLGGPRGVLCFACLYLASWLERLEKAGGRDAFWYCLVQCNDRLVRTVPLQITENSVLVLAYFTFVLGTLSCVLLTASSHRLLIYP